jgi:hypothetical protein
MSINHVLLDSLKLLKDPSDKNSSYPLSEYINESQDLEKVSSLNNTPSLLKFILSEKKDLIEVINENKFRAIKDNVTDAFVNEFFIGNYEKLNMLLDYQYHLIYFNIMLKINTELINTTIQKNRDGKKLEKENMYPLQYNEHILLNFKGGSTMYYLYNNIIKHLSANRVDITQFDKIKEYFKISDIDLSLNIETGNSYRYFQLESTVSSILANILEELTNRLEFMYLNKILLATNTIIINNPKISAIIKQIKDNLELEKTLDNIYIKLHPTSKRVYPNDIYAMKLKINELKYELNVDINETNIIKAIDFIKTFIEHDYEPSMSILKSVDMLEISLLTEFVNYMTRINYSTIPNHKKYYLKITSILLKLEKYGKHLLNVKYKYLLDNLYNIDQLDGFITKIKDGLQNQNTKSLKNAKEALAKERAELKIRTRLCNNPEIEDLTDLSPDNKYYQDYRYFTESKSEIKSIYNLVDDNTNITKDKINFSGRENFLLRPQDSSKYPYLIVTTTNYGLNSDDIKELKNEIVVANGSDKVVVKFGKDLIELDFSNNNNIHYLSINKSIFMENSRFVTTFNLFRIKFNVTLSNLIESISVDKLPSNNCISTMLPLTNAPSEFLDVGISSKDDTFHSIANEIEEHNNGIIFEIVYDPTTVPVEYGTQSRILSYNIKTFAADLNNVLYCQQKIPWLDLKYQKRLFRLLFYIFNVLHNEHQLPPANQPNPPNEHVNTIIIDVFNELFDKIDQNLITYNNIVTNHNNFTTPGNLIDTMIETFIRQISIDGSDIFITTQTIKDLILSGRELHNHLLLKPKYKIADGFFSYTIIYILLIKKLKDEITNTPANLQLIIAEYSKLIQIFYDKSGISFNIKNYYDENQMNESIVKGFINDFGLYIKNIKDAIKTLALMFNAVFNYNTYNILPIDSNP